MYYKYGVLFKNKIIFACMDVHTASASEMSAAVGIKCIFYIMYDCYVNIARL